MITTLLILHALVGVALLGAITHQIISIIRGQHHRGGSFIDRYTGVQQNTFTAAIVILYVLNVAIGAIIYPTYRLNVRIPFEEMGLGWGIGIFELKEHFAGIGLFLLPIYFWLWNSSLTESHRSPRIAITATLTFVVWWDFVVGHILNNLRGLA